jgi:hypothetical protein
MPCTPPRYLCVTNRQSRVKKAHGMNRRQRVRNLLPYSVMASVSISGTSVKRRSCFVNVTFAIYVFDALGISRAFTD